MTTDLWEENGELPKGIRFWGGEKRGVCIELIQTTEHGEFISVAKSDVSRLIKHLRQFIEGEYD